LSRVKYQRYLKIAVASKICSEDEAIKVKTISSSLSMMEQAIFQHQQNKCVNKFMVMRGMISKAAL